MTITRRGLLAGILSAAAAPAIVHSPMRLWVPRYAKGGYVFPSDLPMVHMGMDCGLGLDATGWFHWGRDAQRAGNAHMRLIVVSSRLHEADMGLRNG